jgi:hypothetical protein
MIVEGENSMSPTTTNDNAKIGYKSSGPVEIPRQLQRPEFRFNILKGWTKERKHPMEPNWYEKHNYTFNDQKLNKYLDMGRNYGVCGGFGDLLIADLDDLQRLAELGVIDKLPETFVVKSGGGKGQHWYYICHDWTEKVVMFDPVLKDDNGNFEHLGEIQWKRFFVVGPGSKHDRTDLTYEIINPHEIAEISKQQLMEIIRCLKLNEKKEKKPFVKTYNNNNNEVRCIDIVQPDHENERVGSTGREIYGENPFHGATHPEDRGKSTNFSINIDKNVWTCRACDSGGGPVELQAVKMGIIRCNQAGKGCLNKEQYIEVMEQFKEEGKVMEWTKITEARETETTDPVCQRTLISTIPKSAPEQNLVVLRAPPRSGKTHAAITWLLSEGSGNYLTHNHAIVSHVVMIAYELGMESIVWREGKRQEGMCPRKLESCDGCPMKPDEQNKNEGGMGYFELMNRARQLLTEKKILTRKDIPSDLCPYFTLKFAEKEAKYCFTVVNNINDIEPRRLTIIDEDPALDHFYTPSIKIASIKHTVGDSSIKTPLARLEPKIKEMLESKKRVRTRPTLEKLREIKDILEQPGREEKTADMMAMEIRKTLEDWKPSNKYVRDEHTGDDDDITIESCINCLTHLYKENPVSTHAEFGGYKSISLLGDARIPDMNMDWFGKAEKVVIIGAAKAELFAKALGGTVLELPDFKYLDRFVVLAVGPDEKEGTKQGKTKKIRAKLGAIARELNKDTGQGSAPLMVLVGSKREQDKVAEWLGAERSTTQRELEQEMFYIHGRVNTFYQNSIISRGLDVDFYNVIIALGTNFAQPFWSVADPNIARQILVDETTNSVLRISPTQRRDKGMAKVILISEEDLGKIKYMGQNVIWTHAPAKTISKALRDMRIPGVCKRTGEGKSEVIEWGVDAKDIYNRLDAQLVSLEDYVEKDVMDIADIAIYNIMKDNKKHWYTLGELRELVKMPTKVVREALVRRREHMTITVRKITSGGKGGAHDEFRFRPKKRD